LKIEFERGSWWRPMIGLREDRQRSAKRSDRDIPGVVPEVNEARRALKAAIVEKLDASEEEQRRVASILHEAAAAIRAPSGALVLSSVQDCAPCEELAAGGFYRLYRVP